MKGLKLKKFQQNILEDAHLNSVNQPMTARTSRDLKIIRFTGNMKQNTNILLEGIQCNCGLKRDYTQIIHAYGDKITKLREERNHFKESFHHEKHKNQQIHDVNKRLIQEIAQLEKEIMQNRSMEYAETIIQRSTMELKKKIKQLQEQKLSIYEEYKELQCNFNELNLQLIEAQNTLRENVSRIKRDQKEEDMTDLLNDSMKDLFDDKMQVKLCLKQNQLLKAKLSKHQQMLKQFDCTMEEVRQVLSNHFQNMPRFQTQEQKNLYQLATQMNVDLWRKKVEMDVRVLTQRKSELRRLQESVGKKRVK